MEKMKQLTSKNKALNKTKKVTECPKRVRDKLPEVDLVITTDLREKVWQMKYEATF